MKGILQSAETVQLSTSGQSTVYFELCPAQNFPTPPRDQQTKAQPKIGGFVYPPSDGRVCVGVVRAAGRILDISSGPFTGGFKGFQRGPIHTPQSHLEPQQRPTNTSKTVSYPPLVCTVR